MSDRRNYTLLCLLFVCFFLSFCLDYAKQFSSSLNQALFVKRYTLNFTFHKYIYIRYLKEKEEETRYLVPHGRNRSVDVIAALKLALYVINPPFISTNCALTFLKAEENSIIVSNMNDVICDYRKKRTFFNGL